MTITVRSQATRDVLARGTAGVWARTILDHASAVASAAADRDLRADTLTDHVASADTACSQLAEAAARIRDADVGEDLDLGVTDDTLAEIVTFTLHEIETETAEDTRQRYGWDRAGELGMATIELCAQIPALHHVLTRNGWTTDQIEGDNHGQA